MSSHHRIYGLVLSGGLSSRMKEDKGELSYHGKPQKEYVFDLLSEVCERTFISVASKDFTESSLPIIVDIISDAGPFSGVYSAFHTYPDVAWLVVACDFPLLDKESILQIMDGRNADTFATVFWDDRASAPEPLLTLWEPKVKRVMDDMLIEGKTSLRSILLSQPVEVITPIHPAVLLNVNTQEERNAIMDIISQRTNQK